MPGANYMGGKRNFAKARSRDYNRRVQKSHFGKKRAEVLSKGLVQASSPHTTERKTALTFALSHASRDIENFDQLDEFQWTLNAQTSTMPPPAHVYADPARLHLRPAGSSSSKVLRALKDTAGNASLRNDIDEILRVSNTVGLATFRPNRQDREVKELGTAGAISKFVTSPPRTPNRRPEDTVAVRTGHVFRSPDHHSTDGKHNDAYPDSDLHFDVNDDSGYAEFGSSGLDEERAYSPYADFELSQERYFEDNADNLDEYDSPSKPHRPRPPLSSTTSLDIIDFPSSPLPASSLLSTSRSTPSVLRTPPQKFSSSQDFARTAFTLNSPARPDALSDLPLARSLFTAGQYMPYGRLLELEDPWNAIGNLIGLPAVPSRPDSPVLELIASLQVNPRRGVGWSPQPPSIATPALDTAALDGDLAQNDRQEGAGDDEALDSASLSDDRPSVSSGILQAMDVDLEALMRSTLVQDASRAELPLQAKRNSSRPVPLALTPAPPAMPAPSPIASVTPSSYLSTADVDLDALLPQMHDDDQPNQALNEAQDGMPGDLEGPCLFDEDEGSDDGMYKG